MTGEILKLIFIVVLLAHKIGTTKDARLNVLKNMDRQLEMRIYLRSRRKNQNPITIVNKYRIYNLRE